jgi:hypothetical protein
MGIVVTLSFELLQIEAEASTPDPQWSMYAGLALNDELPIWCKTPENSAEGARDNACFSKR